MTASCEVTVPSSGVAFKTTTASVSSSKHSNKLRPGQPQSICYNRKLHCIFGFAAVASVGQTFTYSDYVLPCINMSFKKKKKKLLTMYQQSDSNAR